jgi:NAD(P)-dependent dehydrogenase (short-subunit alcohol dehydrogenase family)
MSQLDGKVALVTGGAHGFGRVLALTLARAGADIAIADVGRSRQSGAFGAVPDRKQIAGVVEEVKALGRRAIGLLTDVRKDDECRRMAQDTIESFGTVDILCANAGTFLDDMRPAWELPEADWDVVFDVNLKGAWLTTKHVVPHMLSRRAGKIIFTGSRNSLKAEPNYAHYVAAKHGLLGYMKALAIELGPFEINVNAVCPTQMVDKSRPPRSTSRPYWDRVVGHAGATYEEFDLKSGEENLFARRGQLDFTHVAQAVLWLASDASRAVTGAILSVDNGWAVKHRG